MLAGALMMGVAVANSSTPTVKAKRCIVIDDATGAVLFEKKSLEKCAVASTQKLLTALCVTEAGSMENTVFVKHSDTTVEPTKLYVKSGEQYSRATLVKALLVKSSNDAARALARDVAGSEAKFAVVMNAKAKKLGMNDSHFKNSHGLTETGQYSTARDLAILARSVTRHPTLASHMKNKGYYFYPSNGGKKWLTNTNRLLKSMSCCTGMKTGTTRASGRCLVCSGELGGRKVIVVCLGSDSQNIWKDSEKLLKWALEGAGKPAVHR